MNIYDLPIVADETLKDKTKAFIHENKIVCHPDLVNKVTEGMKLMKASAAGFDRDFEILKETIIGVKNEQKKDTTTDSPTNADSH